MQYGPTEQRSVTEIMELFEKAERYVDTTMLDDVCYEAGVYDTIKWLFGDGGNPIDDVR